MINIYVGNLPYTTTESELVELFSTFGQVNKATLVNDRQTGRPRGFGFVEMTDYDAGTRAIESLSGELFNGRHLTTNEARNRQQTPSSGAQFVGESPRQTEDTQSFGRIGGGYTNTLLNKSAD